MDIERLDQIAQELEGTTPLPVAEAPSLASDMALRRSLQRLLPSEEVARLKLRAAPAPARTPDSTASKSVANRAAAKRPAAKVAGVRASAKKAK